MKPNLIVIGAQKAGTSSLHHYLDMHPEISMSEQKELDYFVEGLNWGKGLDWYESQFTHNTKIRGEASPSYSMYPNFTDVPKKMHSLVPDARLIYILRDPVDRIVSHYLHQWYAKRQDESFQALFSDFNKDKTRHYINTSRYHLQLSQYLEFYDISRICVVTLEELKTDPEKTLHKVFRFLEVDDTFTPTKPTTAVNRTDRKLRTNRFGDLLLSKSPSIRSLRQFAGRILPDSLKSSLRSAMGSTQKRPDIPIELQDALRETLQDDVQQLRKLTGRTFSQWKI